MKKTNTNKTRKNSTLDSFIDMLPLEQKVKFFQNEPEEIEKEPIWEDYFNQRFDEIRSWESRIVLDATIRDYKDLVLSTKENDSPLLKKPLERIINLIPSTSMNYYFTFNEDLYTKEVRTIEKLNETLIELEKKGVDKNIINSSLDEQVTKYISDNNHLLALNFLSTFDLPKREKNTGIKIYEHALNLILKECSSSCTTRVDNYKQIELNKVKKIFDLQKKDLKKVETSFLEKWHKKTEARFGEYVLEMAKKIQCSPKLIKTAALGIYSSIARPNKIKEAQEFKRKYNLNDEQTKDLEKNIYVYLSEPNNFRQSLFGNINVDAIVFQKAFSYALEYDVEGVIEDAAINCYRSILLADSKNNIEFSEEELRQKIPLEKLIPLHKEYFEHRIDRCFSTDSDYRCHILPYILFDSEHNITPKIFKELAEKIVKGLLLNKKRWSREQPISSTKLEYLERVIKSYKITKSKFTTYAYEAAIRNIEYGESTNKLCKLFNLPLKKFIPVVKEQINGYVRKGDINSALTMAKEYNLRKESASLQEILDKI